MKNCELAVSGSLVRAAPMVPRTKWVVRELGLEVGEVGAAAAGAGRVAALRHEALDDAVEGRVVVEALLGERLHPLDVLRREVGPELDDDAAGGEVHEERVLRVELRGKGRGDADERQGHDQADDKTHSLLLGSSEGDFSRGTSP